MEKPGYEEDVDSSLGDMVQETSHEERKLALEQCIQSLVHACQCRDANCRLQSCLKMKRVVTHTKICKRKTKGDCPICKQLVALTCYHANHCQETQCIVPFCSSIKQKMEPIHLCMQQAQLLQQRMAAMNTHEEPGASSPPHSPPALASPPPSLPAAHALPHDVQKALQQEDVEDPKAADKENEEEDED